ncbi:MAG TPA: ABC transporter ATP-binding protein [Dehalococcoidia bacterium]|nr:ABC transporter ATP-binding protein [Dehalococcoidia bacterium]
MPSDVMIETKGLTKKFGKLMAVDSLDVKVQKGIIHGFVGPNGAGKTTTIKLLVGAIRRTSGEGFIKGYPIGSVDARRAIGYSPERPSFYKDWNAFDYLVHMAALSGIKTDEAERRSQDLLEWLELSDFARAKVGGFSAGMKQRLSIAQAMSHKPELLVLDEPTANLDPDGRMSLLEKLKSLPREQGVTVFISSHILSELEFLIDSVTLINKGRTVAEDSVKVMKEEISLNRYVLNTSNNQAVMKALQGHASILEMKLGNDGAIHISSPDMGQLQSAVMEVVTKTGSLLKYFGEEQVKLEDIYRSTMDQGKDK